MAAYHPNMAASQASSTWVSMETLSLDPFLRSLATLQVPLEKGCPSFMHPLPNVDFLPLVKFHHLFSLSPIFHDIKTTSQNDLKTILDISHYFDTPVCDWECDCNGPFALLSEVFVEVLLCLTHWHPVLKTPPLLFFFYRLHHLIWLDHWSRHLRKRISVLTSLKLIAQAEECFGLLWNVSIFSSTLPAYHHEILRFLYILQLQCRRGSFSLVYIEQDVPWPRASYGTSHLLFNSKVASSFVFSLTARNCTAAYLLFGAPELQELYMGYYNNYSSGIPPSFGNLSNLVRLDMGSCGLNGSIPLELGNLTNLDTLFLQLNGLMGVIPTQVGNLVNLRSLDLSYNILSGVIPAALVYLQKLELLNLMHNNFEGGIPSFLGDLPNLQVGLNVRKFLCSFQYPNLTSHDMLNCTNKLKPGI